MDDSLYARALRITPGAAQTRSKQWTRFPATFPDFIARGAGPYVFDWSGRQYVDFMCSNAAAQLGHAHPALVEALTRQSAEGGMFGLPSPLEVEVGERLCAAVGFDQIRWTVSGSEANEGAMRIARLATGRDRILRTDYLGWHSLEVAAEFEHPGVPDVYADTLAKLAPNDLPALIKELESGRIAAVMLEPGRTWRPDPGYLLDVVTEAHHAGALVAFDCVVTFGRFSLRGWVDEWLDSEGVTPDLVTYGKALSGGAFPVSAIVGRRDVMQHAVWVSGTHNGHPVGLAVVDAVLDLYEREPILKRIWECGRQLIAMMDGIPHVGLPPHPIFQFPDASQALAFYGTLAQEGVLAHPNSGWNPSAAHDATAMAVTFDAVQVARKVAGV